MHHQFLNLCMLLFAIGAKPAVAAVSLPQPGQVAAFFPYDYTHGLDSASNQVKASMTFDPKLRKDLEGPFGSYGTSHSVGSNFSYIAEYDALSTSASFTYSFAVYPSGYSRTTTSGILLNDSPARLSIGVAQDYSLEFHSHAEDNTLNIPDVILAYEWNFFAVSYDASTSKLTVFDGTGAILRGPLSWNIPVAQQPSLTRFYTGLHKNASERYFAFQPSDALTCIFVYNVVLSGSDVALLKDYCRENMGPGTAPENPVTKPATIPTQSTVSESTFELTTGTSSTSIPSTIEPSGSGEMTTSEILESSTMQDTTTSTIHKETTGEALTTDHLTTSTGVTSSPTTTRPRTPPPPRDTPWPQPAYLLGFWPLSKSYGSKDVGPNDFKTSSTPSLTHPTGPFGDSEQASAKSSAGQTEVLKITSGELTAKESFTLSVFMSLENPSGDGVLFEFLDASGSATKSFQFRQANSSALEISANGESLIVLLAIQPQRAWTFLALAYESTTDLLTVFSRHGVLSPAKTYRQIASARLSHTKGLRLGKSATTKDAFSCLMVYSVALNQHEIDHVFDACRIIHGAAPCGTPKLAISPIPSASKTAVPKDGQFPWAVSLQKGSKHVCSASILDQFWLITSAFCIELIDPSDYSVTIAEYDLAVNEAHSTIHQIEKIYFKSLQNSDIALLQTKTPINFGSDYVNDICLYKGDVASLSLTSAQFVSGWGVNGRSQLVSQTLPRYVPGWILTNDQCVNAWTRNSYRIGQDFCFLSSTTDRNVPCEGDEGAALLVEAPANTQAGIGDRLVQIGVYYGRDATCNGTKPGLFTALEPYSHWIAEKLACTIPGVYYPESCPQN